MKVLTRISLIALIFPLAALAAPLKPEQVPEPLKPWIDWVLMDQADRNCPFRYNDYTQKRCVWPTELNLEIEDQEGRFSALWTVYREGWVSLPGDRKHWPQNVTVEQHSAIVQDRNGVPTINLHPGAAAVKYFKISGDFQWDSIPDNLTIPPETALIRVNINKQTNPSAFIKDGQLWLNNDSGADNKTANLQNAAELQVFRKIVDEIPLQVITRLVLDISGEPREIILPSPIPGDLIALSLQSPLPARLEPDGRLFLQAKPGHWPIEITARSVGTVDDVFRHEAPGKEEQLDGQSLKWPQSELWVYDARPELRIAEIEGLRSVDPSQTNLPNDWKSLPAYRVGPGERMRFKTLRRGDPEPEPNQLDLIRKLWLDFDGGGYTVNDTINGTMTRDWRLDALSEIELGRVVLNGINQLITQSPSGNKQGVEVRKGAVSLLADSRMTGSIGRISALGWEQRFRSVRTELNLPPGWRLFAAIGVDNVPDSWISRWTLLDFFLVLVSALAIGRLWTAPWGIVALITLTLCWYENGAPQYIWLHSLAATALVRVLPGGRALKLVKLYRNISWLALVIISVPFMADQIRTSLYPQLEKPAEAAIIPQQMEASIIPSSPEAKSIQDEEAMNGPSRLRAKVNEYALGGLSGRYSAFADKVDRFERIDPMAKVQTGPGLPQWQWNTLRLSWNGSVDAGQRVVLWYLSPGLNRLLNVFRVGLLSILVLLMFGLTRHCRMSWFSLKTLLPGLVLLPLLMGIPVPSVAADIPDPALLAELKNRLLPVPDCLPSCASIASMKLLVSDRAIDMAMEVHVQDSVTLPLPVDYNQWFPSQVAVDGNTTIALYRQGTGLWLTLSQGVHHVVLSGATPTMAKFIIPLPLRPGHVSFTGDGWEISGIQSNGVAQNQLLMARSMTSGKDSSKEQSVLAPGVLPPFVRVERELQLGIDWRLLTKIVRLSPPDSPIAMTVPIWHGESVTTSGVHVNDGRVNVNMRPEQTEYRWESVLAKSESIELIATHTDQWIEVWRADVSPIWHLETSGIAMIHSVSNDQWLPEWHPWPGEKVVMHLTRPPAAKGRTLTIDNSRLIVRPGLRARDIDLSLSLRSSQGGQHTIILAEDAELQSVEIDGRAQPIRQENRKLTFPLRPGEQRISLHWRQAVEINSVLSSPDIDLGQDSVNASTTIALGQDRWVLLVFGPNLGPAVLFWGMLILMIALSLVLDKQPLTPLKHWQWFLLLIGLGQIPIGFSLVVVFWLLVLGWRKIQIPKEMLYFNAFQVFLTGLTLVALSMLFYSVSQGLLGSSDMHVAGNQSSAHSLNWYQDKSPAKLPIATVISAPIGIYRFLMLAWSLWLAISLIDWLKWGWNCFAANGLWQKKKPKNGSEV